MLESKKNQSASLKILFVVLFLCGGFLGHTMEARADSGDWSGARKAVIQAYKTYQTEVDVSSYNLNYETEYDELKSMMNQVVSETPYLFYTGTRFSVSRNTSTNQIIKITLGYGDEYKKTDGTIRKKKIKNTRIKLDAAIDTALSNIEPSMTKIEKAMVLHDYIISNTVYTKDTTKQYRVTEVGVFLKHKANCEGYSRAYAILMEKVGIPVKFVTSDEMVHMWNKIKIGKSWYHVDVTWDDPLDSNDSADQYGRVSHENFLCSNEKIQKNGHTDFVSTDTVSTKYDKKYWKNVTVSFYYRDGSWLYMTKKGIVERKKLAGGSKEVLYNVVGDNFVKYSSDLYYFIAYNSIYLYNYKTNEAKAVWKTSELYSSSCVLDQITYTNGKLYYKVLENGTHISNKITPNEDGTI
jgi:flagellin-like hook-associated protein FlgL